jgi:hypothetical protein
LKSSQEGAGWPHRSLFVRTPHIGGEKNTSFSPHFPHNRGIRKKARG